MPRKGENIYKRKDGRWEGRYIKGRTLEGKAIYGYIYAKSYKEAKASLTKAICLLNTSEQKDNNPITDKTFQNIAGEWFCFKETQIKESTSVKYHNMWNKYISKRLGKIYINEITHLMLEDFCNELMTSGGVDGRALSPKTTSDILSVVRNILRFAENRGHQIGNDGRLISIKQSVKELRVFSIREQAKLCEYLSQNLNMKSMGILVCLYTGIRIGEICALQWEDISMQEKNIYIHQTMQRIQVQNNTEKKTKIIITEPKSSCSIRTIPIPDNLFQMIMHCNVQKNGYFLTCSHDTYIEPRTMQNYFKRVLKSCSIENANYHTLRHTFATRCVELGFDVKSLSELLGHANVSITMNRYVHPSLEWKRNNMEKLCFPFTVK